MDYCEKIKYGEKEIAIKKIITIMSPFFIRPFYTFLISELFFHLFLNILSLLTFLQEIVEFESVHHRHNLYHSVIILILLLNKRELPKTIYFLEIIRVIIIKNGYNFKNSSKDKSYSS